MMAIESAQLSGIDGDRDDRTAYLQSLLPINPRRIDQAVVGSVRAEAARAAVPAQPAPQRRLDGPDAEPPEPLRRATSELESGQRLRRAGRRRAAARRLQAARDLFAGLPARPELELCDRELAACGLTPAKRSSLDPRRLTPQESAVARLVAQGMGNRQVAEELFVSIKTVQFHLTHIYTKLGINNRAELAAHFRADTDASALNCPITDSCPPTDQRDDDSDRLTNQESAVARLVAQGMGNRQVAGELFVSIKTVQFHLTHIYTKLGINNRAELAAHWSPPEN